jgi:hypothetical protein
LEKLADDPVRLTKVTLDQKYRWNALTSPVSGWVGQSKGQGTTSDPGSHDYRIVRF